MALTRNPLVFLTIRDAITHRHRAIEVVGEGEASLPCLEQLLSLRLVGVRCAVIFVALSTYEDVVRVVCLQAARGHVVVRLAVGVDAL